MGSIFLGSLATQFVAQAETNFNDLVDFTIEVKGGRDIRVLQLTDPQILDAAQIRQGRTGIDLIGWNTDKMSYKFFDCATQIIKGYNPDLILITGDLVYGEFDDNGTSLIRLIKFMDSFKIPWAPVFGNHDNESYRGVDWQCEQLENSQYCLFKQRKLTGNGNYSVGVIQNGKLVRTFYMLDSNGCGSMSTQSLANGHSKTAAGFGTDQIKWYTQSINAIKQKSPLTKFSLGFHIQLEVFRNAYSTLGISPAKDLDQLNDSQNFGYLGKDLKSPWDKNFSVWNGIKELGIDSVFVGHEHSNSASVMYQGVRLAYGLKTGTYDRANYKMPDGSIQKSYNVVGEPIIGGTAIVLNGNGSIKDTYHIYYKENSNQNSSLLSPLYATFKVDGKYFVNPIPFEPNTEKLVNVPEVPYKEGYVGFWEKYILGNEDITVKAVYKKHAYCNCKEKVATENYIATEAACNVPATYYKSCICGKKGTQVFSSGKKNPDNHKSLEFVYIKNNNGTHKKSHKCCGAVVDAKIECTYGDDNICDICGFKSTSKSNDKNTVETNKITTEINESETSSKTNSYKNLILWISVSLISAIGVGISAFVFYKKKIKSK